MRVVVHLEAQSLRSTLMVERGSLHASVPGFDFGVLHHVIKRLKSFHHSEDSEHRLQVGGRQISSLPNTGSVWQVM